MKLPRSLLAVFAAALGMRLGYRFLTDEPLLYAHQHIYLWSALRILEHPDPLRFVLGSDEWRSWGADRWTLAPLYQLSLAGFFALFGRRLLPLQVAQCALDSLTAVLVAALARRLSPRYGTWAGLGYALYWPAVAFAMRTMTENLHTFLLVAALLALARSAGEDRDRWRGIGGFLLGLSALARAVSTAFVPVAALLAFCAGAPRRTRGAVVVLLAAAAAILPWTARNAFFAHDPVLIESVGFYNLWRDNVFADEARLGNQERQLREAGSPAARRAVAARLALREIARHPRSYADKVSQNVRHLLHLDAAHGAWVALAPKAGWWDDLGIVLGDGLLLLSLPLFGAFAMGGRPSPARTLVLLWCGLYAFLLCFVFHVETRYRSALMPFVFVGAAAGVGALGSGPTRRRSRLGFGLGLLAAAAACAEAAEPARAAFDATRSVRSAAAPFARGDAAAAAAVVEAAAERHPASAIAWLRYAEWLAARGQPEAALDAFDRVLARFPGHPTVRVVRPRLLADAGREEEAAQALEDAHQVSLSLDAWIALENAWRLLPPPRTDEIRVGAADYGAVRGFFDPRGSHRWTRGRAWLRLVPATPASVHELTLEMGSPEPSPLASPRVRVRIVGGDASEVVLDRTVRRYTFRASSAGAPILVEIETPTWLRAGQPADQGIRVDRMSVRPAP